MTYQAASGAGAKNMIELVDQMATISRATEGLRSNPSATALEYDTQVTNSLRDGNMPLEQFLQQVCRKIVRA